VTGPEANPAPTDPPETDPTASVWKVELTPAAVRQLRKLDGMVRRRVVTAIDRLAITPRPAGVKALTDHPGLLRLRVGDYRVVYTVRNEQLVVLVIAVAHRREVYRDL
jgi:mRNA interferase RelE/StbE